MGAKICQIVNNSAGGCSILIKLTTDYDHVTPDLPQTFKVNGQGHVYLCTMLMLYDTTRYAGIKRAFKSQSVEEYSFDSEFCNTALANGIGVCYVE